jgi:nitroimidazol reductase NimA-like FMN-containing flavoprotein (pyridoxamine 5'-phosphate oxidase superfamily)
MLIQKLTSTECRAELECCGVGRMAFVRHGLPHIVPMRFSYDGYDLYGFSMLGEKIECLRENPSVCVQFDNQSNHFHWRSVIATGFYEELPDSLETVEARQHAHEVLQKYAMWWQPATVATEPRNAFVPIFFRIRVNSLTGRHAKPDPVEAIQLSNKTSPAVRSGAIRRILSQVVRPSKSIAGRHKH